MENIEFKTLNPQNISRRINMILEASGYSVNQLSQIFGVSPQAIHKWTNSDNQTIPDIQHLYDISQLAGVTIDYIVAGDKPP